MKLLIIQPEKAGDIIRCLPIAEHYSTQYEVHWLCKKEYNCFFDYVDYVKPVNNPDYFVYDKVIDMSFGVNIFSDIHSAWIKEREKYDSFITFKYNIAEVDVSKCYSLNFKRNTDKEDVLTRLLIFGNEPYSLVHNVSGCFTADIQAKNPVYYTTIEGFTPFDWIRIIEQADEIHAIDSSLVNLIEMLPPIKAKLFYYLTEKVASKWSRTLISDRWTIIKKISI